MSVMTDIADAIASEINDQTWPLAFVAKRMNSPRIQRESACDIAVIVTPKGKATETVSRNKSQDILTFYVGIQQALKNDDNRESDPLIELGELIQAYFDQGLRLADYPTTVCEATSFGSDTDSPWMSIKDSDELLLYTGVILLTFRVHR